MQGLRFSEKVDVFIEKTALRRVRAYKPWIVTASIDGQSGLMRSHTRWTTKYHSIFYQIVVRLLGYKKAHHEPSNIFFTSTVCSIQKHFEKGLLKSRCLISIFETYILIQMYSLLWVFNLFFLNRENIQKTLLFNNPDSSQCVVFCDQFLWKIAARKRDRLFLA